MPAANCASTATPGSLSPASIRLIVFRDTPHLRHRAYWLKPCASRSSCIRRGNRSRMRSA